MSVLPARRVPLWQRLVARLPPPARGVAGPAAGAVRGFFADGLHDYASALAYRGLLALVPAAIVGLTALDLAGASGALPRVEAWLARFRPPSGGDLSVGALLSTTALIGAWSLSMSARTLMRALNVAFRVDETRSAAVRGVLSIVALPLIALTAGLATAALLLTSRGLAAVAAMVGVQEVTGALAPGLRLVLALGLVGGAVAAVYRFGADARPPLRALGVATALATVLWGALTAGFASAVGTVVDYGRAYGSLGSAVALLVYLYFSFGLLLAGARLTATLAAAQRRRRGYSSSKSSASSSAPNEPRPESTLPTRSV